MGSNTFLSGRLMFFNGDVMRVKKIGMVLQFCGHVYSVVNYLMFCIVAWVMR